MAVPSWLAALGGAVAGITGALAPTAPAGTPAAIPPPSASPAAAMKMPKNVLLLGGIAAAVVAGFLIFKR